MGYQPRISGGTPGGTSGQIQYNNAGAFAGASGISINGGAISAVTVVEAANTTALTILDGLVNGSGTTPFVNISGTWNTSGVLNGYQIAITETAVGAASRLFSILGGAGGVTEQFGVLAGGFGIRITNGSGLQSLGTDQLGFISSGTTLAAGLTSTQFSVIGGVNASSIVVGNGNLSKNITLSHDGTNAFITPVTGALRITNLTGNGIVVTSGGSGLLSVNTSAQILTDDTGWTANADAGSKTAVIPSSATIATVQTALNLAVSGAGDLLAATAQKCKALETALVANLLPNA